MKAVQMEPERLWRKGFVKQMNETKEYKEHTYIYLLEQKDHFCHLQCYASLKKTVERR